MEAYEQEAIDRLVDSGISRKLQLGRRDEAFAIYEREKHRTSDQLRTKLDALFSANGQKKVKPQTVSSKPAKYGKPHAQMIPDLMNTNTQHNGSLPSLPSFEEVVSKAFLPSFGLGESEKKMLAVFTIPDILFSETQIREKCGAIDIDAAATNIRSVLERLGFELRKIGTGYGIVHAM